MIEYKDSFQQETIITVLPIKFNKTVQFSVNSKYKYIAVWNINIAKKILQELETTIQTLEKNNDKEI